MFYEAVRLSLSYFVAGASPGSSASLSLTVPSVSAKGLRASSTHLEFRAQSVCVSILKLGSGIQLDCQGGDLP